MLAVQPAEAQAVVLAAVMQALPAQRAELQVVQPVQPVRRAVVPQAAAQRVVFKGAEVLRVEAPTAVLALLVHRALQAVVRVA